MVAVTQAGRIAFGSGFDQEPDYDRREVLSSSQFEEEYDNRFGKLMSFKRERQKRRKGRKASEEGRSGKRAERRRSPIRYGSESSESSLS